MSLLLKQASMVMVRDCTGQMVAMPRPMIGVERYVAWADTRNERRALDAQLTAGIEDVARSHRVDVWRALRDGWQPGEYDRILAEAIPRYQAVISRYTNALTMAAERWAMDEAVRQSRSSDTQSAPASPMRQDAVVRQIQRQSSKLESRITAASDLSARQIAARVQGEVAAAVRDGKTQGQWTTAIKAASLAAPAVAVGQIIESEGRMSAAANLIQSGAPQRLGLRLAQVVRTSVNDSRRCKHCKDLDGKSFDLPAQQAQFDAMPLPDPKCEGGTQYCRCGWLLRWVRET